MNEVSLPPVLPELKNLLEEYLLDSESLPIHDPKYSRKFWPTYPEPQRLFNPSLNPVTTYLDVERDPATGVITGIKESFNNDLGSTAKNSFSLRRVPGPPEEAVRGSSTNYPFWPGGIPEPSLFQNAVSDDNIFCIDNLLTKHPKLSGGIEFKQEEQPDIKIPEKESPEASVVNLADMLKVDDNVFNIFEIKEEKRKPKAIQLEITKDEEELMNDVKIESVLPPKSKNVIKISERVSTEVLAKGTEWAIVVDVNSPVDNFNAKIPNPAKNYPFELDTFQKQAIIHLENNESVFVAAHTSAGKTVVAEYCIALTLKHMTRSIYTSPIKALSNQKYRDLKDSFGDVGLLTGDIQINPKASCLIMTTEILQSMLYNGSDTIRDLEWVIFDEVHYINNAERGHVWEEVIIMLPQHVNIVLLSATVPNTVEFADWIGRIKKKKIYVISTTKRPVPLEHFLYTGTGGKSKDEKFMIVDSQENFLMKGYHDAVAAKEEREKKSQKLQGPKQKTFIPMSAKQEMNMWIGLLDHLSRNDLLPVVAFTLSKKRCDQNAALLLSQDLTTQKEKGEIHGFIKKCTDRLQECDRRLPQVIHMQSLLKKGIGIHHSGILPMLKEVVEMLFGKGLVKLLFATETFAMGVNMPARSVVFDSIRKHDGTNFRVLLPSEYIQMAGRAGRRGHDTTGTVIILCKADVYNMSDLKNMMLGKPTLLESQFKLTYSMILSLLRVPESDLSVEYMMTRSFSESLKLKNQSKYENDLKLKEKELADTPKLECIMCKGIENFYCNVQDYLQLRDCCLKKILTYPNARKKLDIGRIIKICYKSFQNYIACIVKRDQRDNDKYTVFVLIDNNLPDDNDFLSKSCLAAADDSVGIIEKTSNHDLLEINLSHIIGIAKKVLNVSGEKIVDNVKKRKIPRFQENEPGKSVVEIITELQRINETGAENLEFIDLRKDLEIRNFNDLEQLKQLDALKARMKTHQCLECPQFSEHFGISYNGLKLREDIAHLKYLMSVEALQLHPEYEMRIDVLKQLGYIEENKNITLKGRVACIMGNHELMVTELLFENVFTDKSIEIISALLSSLVFQQKNCSEPTLTEELKSGISQFKEIAQKIGETQQDCGLKEAVGDFVDQFNFGLCEVVYQWASGMSFDKITELTDVQEGIVVKCIQRLDETLRDVQSAAKLIGTPNLCEKMEQASTAIKRDIVFAASLYTQ